MHEVQNLEYDTVVFDTAPTGHTLRLLALPHTLNEALERLLTVQGLPSILSLVTRVLGLSSNMNSTMFTAKLKSWKEKTNAIQKRLSDAKITNFICVCIAEFLSLYETERLIQELKKYNISCKNIVVNQLVKKGTYDQACRLCDARMRVQKKYFDQLLELYDDFHVVQMPLLYDEVRGVEKLKSFSGFLVRPYDPTVDGHLL